MSWVAVAIGGSAAIGAGSSIFGSMLQSNASGNAIDAVKGMYSSGLNQQNQYVQQALTTLLPQAKGAVQPFIDAGAGVIPTLMKLLTPGADMSATLEQIPGFKFAQKYGQKAITNQATSRGLSGNALTAGADYATGAASSTFSGIVEALSKIFQTGTSAGNALAGTIGGLGQGVMSAGNAALGGATNFGKMFGDLITGKGAAEASGVLGAGNALAGGTNALGNVAFLNSLRTPGATGAPTSIAPPPGAWTGSAFSLY